MFCLTVATLIYLWEVIYFQNRSAYSAAGKCVGWSWEYINRTQTQECGVEIGTEAAQFPEKEYLNGILLVV